jgi:hypothetical protein
MTHDAAPESRANKVTIHVKIDESLLQRMVELHIRPSELIRGNLREEIRRREKKIELKKLKVKDARATADWLTSRSTRIRRLRGL